MVHDQQWMCLVTTRRAGCQVASTHMHKYTGSLLLATFAWREWVQGGVMRAVCTAAFEWSCRSISLSLLWFSVVWHNTHARQPAAQNQHLAASPKHRPEPAPKTCALRSYARRPRSYAPRAQRRPGHVFPPPERGCRAMEAAGDGASRAEWPEQRPPPAAHRPRL